MNMQTGFGDAGDRMAEQYMETMTNILLPVLEQAVVLAAESVSYTHLTLPTICSV